MYLFLGKNWGDSLVHATKRLHILMIFEQNLSVLIVLY